MKLIYLVLYELKNRLRVSAAVTVAILTAIMAVAALRPLAEFFKDEMFHTSKFSVALVDEEQSMYTQVFAEQVFAAPSIKDNIDVVKTDRNTAFQKLQRDEVAGIILIPAIFTASMQTGQFAPLEVYLNSSRPLQAQLIREGMESGSYLMSAVQNALYTVYSFLEKIPLEGQELESLFNTEMFTLIGSAIARDQIYVRETKTPWQDLDMISFYGLSILLVFMFILTTSGVAAFYENEGCRLGARLTLLRVKPYLSAFAGVFASGAIIFVSGFLVYMAVVFVTGGTYMTAARYLPFLLLAAVNMSALSLAVGIPLKNPMTASAAVAGLDIFFGLASGVLIPFYYLPEYIPEGIKYFTPHYWWWQMLSPSNKFGGADFFRSVAVTILSTVILFLILRGLNYEGLRDN